MVTINDALANAIVRPNDISLFNLHCAEFAVKVDEYVAIYDATLDSVDN